MFHAKKAADIMRQGYDSLDATLTKKSDDDRAKQKKRKIFDKERQFDAVFLF